MTNDSETDFVQYKHLVEAIRSNLLKAIGTILTVFAK